MAKRTRQILGIFLFLLTVTAFAAVSSLPSRAAPFAAHVMDARTGETLYARNAETRLHPASLTKMLTLYIVFDAIERGEISLDTMVTVSKNAAAQPPSRLGLRAGQRIALRYLIRAAAIKSANDAASAIGDALSGNEAKFAARMNRTAKAIGMTNSTFKNANGLTAPGHLSTARDMSVLGRRLFYDFPQYYNIFSRRSADAGMAQVANTNRRFLDAYKGADGIKTGYTVAAGFNLTASAERGQKRIIATVFGGTSTAQRNAKMMELMDIGFGEAPANARVSKPEPADLPSEAPDLLADSEGQEGAVGKTIRVSMAMKSSPRPRARPGTAVAGEPAFAMAAATPVPAADAEAAAAMVGALQSTINDAVAAAAAPPEPPPFAMASAADAEALGILDARPVARPSDAAQEDAAAEPALTAQAEVVTEPQVTGTPKEEAPMPFAVVDAEGEVIAPPAAPQEVEAMPFAVVDAEGRTVSPAAAADEGALPFALVSPEDLPPAPSMPEETTIVALAAPAPMPVLRPLPAPVTESEPEVVTRLSTSGGRNWGVSLGELPSRGAAERVLTRTVLTEGPSLGDGLRKVVARSGGYDATVLGLTEDQAALACQRLAARAMDCTVIGP